MGWHLPGKRVRLLRPRLLGIRATRHCAPAQLLRPVSRGSRCRTVEDEGRRCARVLRTRARRPVRGPGTHGSRAAFGRASRDCQARRFAIQQPDRQRPAHSRLSRRVWRNTSRTCASLSTSAHLHRPRKGERVGAPFLGGRAPLRAAIRKIDVEWAGRSIRRSSAGVLLVAESAKHFARVPGPWPGTYR
jgi:hypothetical protein